LLAAELALVTRDVNGAAWSTPPLKAATRPANRRYLVMCVNRAEGLSSWRFGFVNVSGQGNG
jgi:hypothetical protein